MIVIIIAIFTSTVSSQGWKFSKYEDNPNGAMKIENLEMDGEYYIVKGADLHNIAYELIGHKIRLYGHFREYKKFPIGKVLILTNDLCYFVIMPTKNIPTDLKIRLDSNGFKGVTGIINKYEGDKITLYCEIEILSKEGNGLTDSVLAYKSCILKTVDKWEKGWTE